MSIVATCPVEQMDAANAALNAAGHGPDNFSVPLFGNSDRPTYAALHAWSDAGFLAALEQLPNVTIHTGFDNDPQAAMQAMLNAQGLKWPGNAPVLPDTGTVMPGEYYRTGGGANTRFWRILAEFDRSTFSGPADQLAASIIREARIPGQVREWRQPIDQFDAYLTMNPFTGQPDRAIYGGEIVEATSGSAGGPGGSLINVSEPGTQNSGWTAVALADGSPLPEPTGPEPWQPYDGTAGSLYQTGDRATHNGFTWESQIDNNSWEPGAAGTEALWVKV